MVNKSCGMMVCHTIDCLVWWYTIHNLVYLNHYIDWLAPLAKASH